MIKLVYCLRRRADVTPDAFYKYWRNEHGPKVKSVAKDIAAVKYIQSHTVAPQLNKLIQESRDLPPPFDGITEVWYESADVAMAAINSPEGQKAMKLLIDDESKFIDFSGSYVFMTEEHEIFDNL